MRLWIGLGGVTAALVAFCGLPAVGQTSAPALAPGSIVSRQTIPAPAGAVAWKIVYASRGLHDEPIVVSGVIIAPAGAGRDRPVVAWAHPTTGVAEGCAPSQQPNFFARIPSLPDLIARGFVVAATDYPGLGTSGVHPYLVGTSEARAVIDSVRAARNVPEAGAGNQFVAWGHSQGAHAALFVAQTVSAYAPELSLAGVAAISPPTQLAPILREDLSSQVGRILTSYALWSWSQLYGVPLASAVRLSTALPIVERIARTCAETKDEGYALEMDAAWTTQRLIKPQIYTTEPWQTLFTENSPAPAHFPYFVAQGGADTIVPPATTSAFVAALCDAKDAVDYDQLAGQGHMKAAFVSAPQAIAWMSDRFQGKPAPNTCPL